MFEERSKLSPGIVTVACCCVLLHSLCLLWSAPQHSPVVDEPGHLVAGISYWQKGQFDLYKVNPHLVRLVALLPLLWEQPEIAWDLYNPAPGARSEFTLGRDLIRAEGVRALCLLTR